MKCNIKINKFTLKISDYVELKTGVNFEVVNVKIYDSHFPCRTKIFSTLCKISSQFYKFLLHSIAKKLRVQSTSPTHYVARNVLRFFFLIQ